MATVPLSKGKVALVDDEDYEWLMQRRWYYVSTRSGYASTRETNAQGRPITIYMHRLILNAAPDQQVDHINHDTLDNRRCNLRLATKTQNRQNQTKHRLYQGRATSSQYKGVSWCNFRKKWTASITKDRIRKWLGAFTDEIEAARAYDSAAREHFGEFAHTNF